MRDWVALFGNRGERPLKLEIHKIELNMNMNMMMIITFLTLIVSSSSSISLAQVLPSPSPSPSSSTTDCVMVLSSLIDCIEYVIGNGTIAPTPQCCNELSGVFDTNSICLCELYNTSLVDAYGINYTTASNLPSSCNLTDSLPTINQCQGKMLFLSLCSHFFL